MEEQEIRDKIKENVEEFFKLKNAKEKFIAGESKILYSGAVFDEKESNAFVSSFLDGWFGLGKKGQEFENNLKKFIGMPEGLVTNSGSSANLIAIAALKSKHFQNQLKKGDEIIVPACSFPTTVNPIILNNFKPVFVDSELGTYNPSIEHIKAAISPKTKAIFLAHTLGNPNDMGAVMQIAKDKNIIVIEDNCDSLGSSYAEQKCGSFGLMSTYSFYPAHHITMGEGGAVLTKSEELLRILKSLRDWGRDCFCSHGSVNHLGECKNRFSHKFENLPEGYDHRYVYSHIGYNLKPLEFQCAFGVEQLKKFPKFMEKRKENFENLNNFFKKYEDIFILPKSLPKADPCWFSYPLTVKEDAGFNRIDLIKHLEKNLIQTRLLFSGNVLRHPAYERIEHRLSGNLKNSDIITERTFFVGVYPGLDKEKLTFIKEKAEDFLQEHTK